MIKPFAVEFLREVSVSQADAKKDASYSIDNRTGTLDEKVDE